MVLSCQLRASGMCADAECALSPSQAQDGACSKAQRAFCLFWGHEPTGTSAHRLRRTWRPGLDSRRNCRVELAPVMAAGAYAPYAHRSR